MIFLILGAICLYFSLKWDTRYSFMDISVFFLSLWSIIVPASYMTDKIDYKKWTTVIKEKIYNPVLLWWKINPQFATADSRKWIEWFIKNISWDLTYKFIPYNNDNFSTVNISIINKDLLNNQMPYGIYKKTINCKQHWIDDLLWWLWYPWVLTCDRKRVFIISKNYFIKHNFHK